MKRTYSKPDVVFESFSLSTSIATGCEVKLDLPYSGGCGVKLDGIDDLYLFLDSVTGCNVPAGDGSAEADGLCYHVPFETNNVFDS